MTTQTIDITPVSTESIGPLTSLTGLLQGPAVIPQDPNTALLAEIAKLRAENQKLAQANSKVTGTSRLTLKVSEKGALSVYGIGRFPVTLYREQWEKLLAPAFVADVQDFIAANGKLLTTKEKK